MWLKNSFQETTGWKWSYNFNNWKCLKSANMWFSTCLKDRAIWHTEKDNGLRKRKMMSCLYSTKWDNSTNHLAITYHIVWHFYLHIYFPPRAPVIPKTLHFLHTQRHVLMNLGIHLFIYMNKCVQSSVQRQIWNPR